MLKATASSIAPSITKMFNLSIVLGKLPQAWKISNVVPIPKGVDPSSAANYHPILLLAILSKCLETHIFDIILLHLHSVDYSFSNQWGFQAGRSTTLALLSTIHDWHLHLENSTELCATFLDLRKAFDTVSHRELMEVLNNLGLPNIILKWLL